MKQSLWAKDYEVNSFLVNTQKKLGLYSLLNLLQDTAWDHATHLGIGYESITRQKMFWVLTRQKLVMNQWPKWGEQIQIRTWIRQTDGGLYINRDFEIWHKETKLGESTTSWITLNSETRKPMKMDWKDFYADIDTSKKLSLEAPKIELRRDLENVAKFYVRNSDIDMNAHVNNTKYAQWVLDSIPLDLHKKYKLNEYEINFLAETKTGDEITMQKAMEEPAVQMHWTQFQGYRASDNKTVFAAKLLIENAD